jgi:hypothetical protein
VPATGATVASGYRLTGADVSGWANRRVRIVGILAPAVGGVASATPGTPAMPDFRVQSVEPIEGTCSPQ